MFILTKKKYTSPLSFRSEAKKSPYTYSLQLPKDPAVISTKAIYYWNCIAWLDVFTKEMYRDVLIESFNYCPFNKRLEIFGWVLMTDHFHLIAIIKEGNKLEHILRDLKKITSRRIIESVIANFQESRKESLLATFKQHGRYNTNNNRYQFWQQDNHPIALWSKDVIKQNLDYMYQKSRNKCSFNRT